MEKNGKMNSGTLAERAELNKETIRFYERKGLLPRPERTKTGYRLYTKKHLDRLIFIINAKGLGFSLKEVSELLEIADGEILSCSGVRKIAEEKLKFVYFQIRNLTRLKKALNDLIQKCIKSGTVSKCPIIESLSKGVK